MPTELGTQAFYRKQTKLASWAELESLPVYSWQTESTLLGIQGSSFTNAHKFHVCLITNLYNGSVDISSASGRYRTVDIGERMDTINSLKGALNGILNDLTQAFAAYVPNLIIALLLCLIGWLLASLLSKLIIRFGHGIDHLSAALRTHAKVETKPLRRPVSHTVANILYWLVILVFIAAALEPLGLPGLSVWIHHFIGFLPELFFAGLILLAGYVLGGAVYENVTARMQLRGSESAEAIGSVAQGGVIGFSLILALSQLNLDVSLLVNIFTIIVAACIGGIGLAFGIGASDQVTNILAAHQLSKMYRIGQTVQIAGIEGEILELTTTAVVLDTEAGRVVIPAKRFSEEVTTLIRKEESNG